MKIGLFEKNEILKSAQAKFIDQAIEIVDTDLFVKGLDEGIYHCDLLDEDVFVSTQYAYHKILVQGNLTNVKIAISAVLVKPDPYMVIYDSTPYYYVVTKEQEYYDFIPYQDFLDLVIRSMKKIEENHEEQ